MSTSEPMQMPDALTTPLIGSPIVLPAPNAPKSRASRDLAVIVTRRIESADPRPRRGTTRSSSPVRRATCDAAPAEQLSGPRVVAEHPHDLRRAFGQCAELRFDGISQQVEDHRGEVPHRDLLAATEVE